MFLGYYMFLLSGTIKEEILPTHLEYRPKIPIPSQSDTKKITGTAVVYNTTKNVDFVAQIAR